MFVGLAHAHVASADQTGSCGLTRRIDGIPAAGAAVRSAHYTTKQPSGCNIPGVGCTSDMMDPICGSSARGCAEEECGSSGGLDVIFNSRSYLLADAAAADACGGRMLGGDFGCVDYQGGAYKLAGQTLSMTLDLSGAECGCNAAIYLVAMPQSRARGDCGDQYCDANAVCGVPCAEIDLVEANKVAFVSTVHVADDSNGEAFGLGHYVTAREKRLTSSQACAYGPRASCAIDTNKPFEASFTFASRDFSYNVKLTQEGRTASLAVPVRYVSKPSKGSVGSAAAANQILASQLSAGMTLVVSYWAGATREEMAWLDAPCRADEQQQWGCTDAWVEAFGQFPWTCERLPAREAPRCGRSFRVSALRVSGGSSLMTIGIAALAALLAAAAYKNRETLVPLVQARLATLHVEHADVGMPRAEDEDDEEEPVKPRRKVAERLPKPKPKPKTKSKAKGGAKEMARLRAAESDEEEDDEEQAMPVPCRAGGEQAAKAGSKRAPASAKRAPAKPTGAKSKGRASLD